MEQEEAREEINNYWGKLARAHEFKITEKERDELKQAMQQEIDRKRGEEKTHNYEHLDMAMKTEKEIMPMEKVEITKEKVREAISKMKNNKAAGPDGIKPEVFKEIEKVNTVQKQ